MHPRRLHRRRLEGQGRQWIAIRRRFVAYGLIFAWKSSSWRCGILCAPVGISEVRYFTFSPHSPRPDSSSGSPSGSAAPGLTQVRPIRSIAPGGYSMIAIPPTSRDRETQLLFPSRARGCRGSSIAVPLHVATPVPSCGIAVDRPKRGLQLLRVLSTYM